MRKANLQRTTKETDIRLRLNLDGRGKSKIATGIRFFDHMLEQIARHGGLDMELSATSMWINTILSKTWESRSAKR
jgi:imidazoleglycerol phosphate dehydratase HisB